MRLETGELMASNRVLNIFILARKVATRAMLLDLVSCTYI